MPYQGGGVIEELAYLGDQTSTTLVPDCLKMVKDSYLGDQEAQELMQTINRNPNLSGNLKLHDGLIWYKDRVDIGIGNNLKSKVLEESHCP
jgi:hypothetical protein